MLKIVQATTEEQFQAVMRLRAKMGQWDAMQSKRLGLDPEQVLKVFYPTDVQALRRENTPPAGGLLIATDATSVAGSAAFRRLNANACERHHVFVRTQFRGMHIGRLVVDQLIGVARDASYQTMRLETTTFMPEARALYVSVGFKQSDPYYDVPKTCASFLVFMELRLLKSA
jgi:GNAT superfamily N-acetyltransferase